MRALKRQCRQCSYERNDIEKAATGAKDDHDARDGEKTLVGAYRASVITVIVRVRISHCQTFPRIIAACATKHDEVILSDETVTVTGFRYASLWRHCLRSRISCDKTRYERQAPITAAREERTDCA